MFESFKITATFFFRNFIDLNGKYAVTNYTHLLGSGHISYYLRKYGNLYMYSQQLWESLNLLIKLFYFKRTQRGGSAGRGHVLASNLDPIRKWYMQRTLFLCGWDGERIQKFQPTQAQEEEYKKYKNKMEKIYLVSV